MTNRNRSGIAAGLAVAALAVGFAIATPTPANAECVDDGAMGCVTYDSEEEYLIAKEAAEYFEAWVNENRARCAAGQEGLPNRWGEPAYLCDWQQEALNKQRDKESDQATLELAKATCPNGFTTGTAFGGWLYFSCKDGAANLTTSSTTAASRNESGAVERGVTTTNEAVLQGAEVEVRNATASGVPIDRAAIRQYFLRNLRSSYRQRLLLSPAAQARMSSTAYGAWAGISGLGEGPFRPEARATWLTLLNPTSPAVLRVE